MPARRQREPSPPPPRRSAAELSAVVISLPRHETRRKNCVARLAAAGVAFEWAPAVDGSALTAAERLSSVTPLGRALMTPGMIGCFLSHRRCWRLCVERKEALLVLEDDAVPAEAFVPSLREALEQLRRVDAAWDVLLVGALGCVHPQGPSRYGANLLVGLMGGGWRWPTQVSPLLHIPGRPFGTHAYVVSPAGAAKLLELSPRANFHVDVSAWSHASLRLYLATDAAGGLLARQAGGDTTIGGVADRSWLPSFMIDAYTGAEFSRAFNAPILQLGRGGPVLSNGRSLGSTALLFALAAASRSDTCSQIAWCWFGLQFALIQSLKVQCWPDWPRGGTMLLVAAIALAAARLQFQPPSSCALVPPSASAWARAFAVHLGLTGLVGGPIGLLLHSCRAAPRPGRVAIGVLAGALVAIAVPAAIQLGRRSRPESITWLAAFLSATFGLTSFFKCMAFAFGLFPSGADRDLATWLHWYTSMPEPLFRDGAPVSADPRELPRRGCLVAIKLVGLGLLLSLLGSTPDHSLPLSLGGRSGAAAQWALYLLNCEAHMWAVYLLLSLFLDVGCILVHLCGGATEPPFRNPLLASRSLKEAWGARWNRPVHHFLKRSIYAPCRRRGLAPLPASLLTFLGSGLVHEYTFSIHNDVGYAPGRPCAFFVLMGIGMLAEERVRQHTATRRLCATPAVRAALASTPTFVVAMALRLLVLPAFAPLFMASWIQSGMVRSVGELLPRVHCETQP